MTYFSLERFLSQISTAQEDHHVRSSPNATVSAFRVYNSGAFVVDIHARYSSDGGPEHKADNGDNFPTKQAWTMDPAKKCVAPPIQYGDLVEVEVWVEWGDDKQYPFQFKYDPAGPVQSFTIGGTVRNDRLDYEGPLPPPPEPPSRKGLLTCPVAITP